MAEVRLLNSRLVQSPPGNHTVSTLQHTRTPIDTDHARSLLHFYFYRALNALNRPVSHPPPASRSTSRQLGPPQPVHSPTLRTQRAHLTTLRTQREHSTTLPTLRAHSTTLPRHRPHSTTIQHKRPRSTPLKQKHPHAAA